jgi:nondiscriminating glutamyl-tRNA synthetase
LIRSDKQTKAVAGGVSAHTAADILEVLRERGWLTASPTPELTAWCEHAAALLGGHAANRAGLASLLELIFRYDARELISQIESHVVLSRDAARDVIRQLALHLLDGAPLTSERFKEIIAQLKESMGLRGRELFHPIRLALAGRAGEGELDRVILLLDDAAGLPFAVSVKSARARILEFCAALD